MRFFDKNGVDVVIFRRTSALARLLGGDLLNPLLEAMLRRRAYRPEFFDDLNLVLPGRLKDVDVLVDALKDAHDKGRRITIFSDYDMDGIMCAVILMAALSELGFNVRLSEPDVSLGYGLKSEAVDTLLEEIPDTEVILTSDTGITSYEGIARAHARGVEVWVTDHHSQLPESLTMPKAEIVVDPKRLDETYPLPAICGAYVVWKVLMAYVEKYGTRFEQSQIGRLKVFAGIGTVSDMMPLRGENRVLVKEAVEIAQFVWGENDSMGVDSITGCNGYVSPFRGLHEFCNFYKLKGKLPNGLCDCNEKFFAFQMAPTFNTVKRLTLPVRCAYDIFLSDDPVVRRNAIEYLFDKNEYRKNTKEELLKKLRLSKPDQKYAPYVWITSCEGGFTGLLAQAIRDEYQSVGIVVTPTGKGSFSGSGRAPGWYPTLSRAGSPDGGGFCLKGHDGAFGVYLEDEAELERLAHYLSFDAPPLKASWLAEQRRLGVSDDPFDYYISTFDPNADSGIDVSLFFDFLDELDSFAPFGVGFPRPTGRFTFTPQDVVSWKLMKEGRHIKGFFPNGFSVCIWNAGPLFDAVKARDALSVSGEVSQSYWQEVWTVSFNGNLEGF